MSDLMDDEQQRHNINHHDNNNDDNNNTADAALSQLLSALAAGVRASSRLPLEDAFAYHKALPSFAEELKETQATLLQPLLASILHSSQLLESLGLSSSMLLSSLDDYNEYDENDALSIDDPMLWEDCADICEALLERAEQASASSSATTSTTTTSTLQTLQQWGRSNQQLIKTNTIMDMDKPQVTYKWTHIPNINSRTQPFVPTTLHYSDKPHSVSQLDLSLQPGHGLETRYGALLKKTTNTVAVSKDIIAPSHHVRHVYEPEIQAMELLDDLHLYTMDASPKKKTIPKVESSLLLPATWLDTRHELQQWIDRLSLHLKEKKNPKHARVVAIDLEAHSYRSFAGITCLMQMSYREYTTCENGDDSIIHSALIDTLVLQSCLNSILQPLLADPTIIKVLHGADSDVQWLQRDFGLYIVGLFDTRRAAQCLQLPRQSYAYLLEHYVEDMQPDKSFQLEDWRQRPLPTKMQQYAIQDTYYLLDIYELIKVDLVEKEGGIDLLKQAWELSKQVSLIRYGGEPFDPNQYSRLLQRRRKQGNTTTNASPTAVQEAILKALWEWRDATARQRDESLSYICENGHLLRIAMAKNVPTNLRSLQLLFTTMPPMILQYATEITETIQRAVASLKTLPPPATMDDTNEMVLENHQNDDDNDDGDDDDEANGDEEVSSSARHAVGAPSSAFFRPNGQRVHSRITSPILATDALYKQAGWNTPEHLNDEDGNDNVATTTTGDEDDDGDDESGTRNGKPKRFLSVHESNHNYQTNHPSEHSLGGGREVQEGVRRRLDGYGTVVVAREDGQSQSTSAIEEESKQAEQRSAQVRAELTQEGQFSGVLSLMTSTSMDMLDEMDIDEEGKRRGSTIDKDVGDESDNDVEYAIPRSMREIYKISNRNRSNKKAGSDPTSERGTATTNEKERDELNNAEALLSARGILNTPFFDNDGALKRQRSRTSSRESEEDSALPDDADATVTREEDMAVVKQVGWLKESSNDDLILPFTSNIQTGLLQQQNNAQQQTSNPFFAGAALVGGPLAQGFNAGRGAVTSPSNNAANNKSSARASTKRFHANATAAAARGTTTGSGGKSATGRRQERPDKKEGRTYVYRNNK